MADSESTLRIVEGSVRALSKSEFIDNDIIEIKHEVYDDVAVVEENFNTQSDLKTETSSSKVINDKKGCMCSIEELLMEPYQSREFSKTLKIIEKGRPTPNVTLTVSSSGTHTKRLLKEHYYDRSDWVTGCEALGKLFCWPCLLFDRLPGMWNNVGFDDIGNYHKAYKRHENTQNHIVAAMQLVAFMRNHCGGKAKPSSDDKQAFVWSNREALKRVMESVCAFGSVKETLLKPPALLHLARRDNAFLKEVNNLHFGCINSLTNAFTESFSESLEKTPFVSLFMDEMPEGRIATVLRYTTSDGELRDSFLGFVDGIDFKLALNKIREEYNLGNRLYTVLIGRISDPENLPKDSKLLILHSPAHRMSRVLPVSLQSIKECAVFFRVIDCFEDWLQDPLVEQQLKYRSPNSNTVKWKERSVTALQENSETIEDVVHSLLDDPTICDHLIYTSSLTLQNALKDFEFMFLLRVFNELFPTADALFDIISTSSPNIKLCACTANDYIKVLAWKKEKFSSIWDLVQEKDLERSASKKPRRSGSSKLMAYYGALFESILNIVIKQVELRFSAFKQMEFAELLDMNDNEVHFPPEKCLIVLRNRCDRVESTRLRNELLVSYAQVDFKGLGCDAFLRHLCETGLSEPLKQVTLLARFLVVIPYATKTNYDSCIQLFGKIDKLSKLLIEHPNLFPCAKFNVEIELINTYLSSDSFINKAIQHFAVEHPQIALQLNTSQ